MSPALLDTATKYSTQFVPVLMLLWFRYAFQAVVTFALRYPVQKTHLFTTPNPRFQTLRGVLLLCPSCLALVSSVYRCVRLVSIVQR